MKKYLTFLCSLLLLSFLASTNYGQERPGVAYPVFSDELGNMPQLNKGNPYNLSSVTGDLFQNGADRLTSLQYTDGSWGWPLDAPPTYGNIIAPITMGLAQAYHFTGDADHLTALSKAGAYLLTKTNNFSPSDGYLAATLDQIFGGTTYVQYVKDNYYDPLAAGTYNRNGAGTLYNTEGYVELVRANRSGSQANLAAWDIGMGLVGAAMCGASTAEWIAGVKAEINELDGTGYYDVIGLAGAIYGLAYVGEDFDPTAGEHAAASNLTDLANILSSYQIDLGGFAWNSEYVIPNDQDEMIQETAYAILALNEVNQQVFLSNIIGAGNYLTSTQLVSGGWENYIGSGENNEVTGEALWGLSVSIEKKSVTNVGVDYDFPVNGVKLNFSTLPSGGGTITVQRYNEVPSGYPAPPAGATHAGLWIDFSSSMADFSFNATVTVDVTGLGFDATNSVMYYNSETNSWVAVTGGSYSSGPPETYTFTINHFTPFSFINTPSTAYNVYLSSSSTAAAGIIYPNTDWGITAYDPNDWDFTTPITLYIVPEVGSEYGASDITIEWNNTLFSFDAVDKTGGIYDGGNFLFFYNQLGNTDQVTINASALTNTNFTISGGDYIAKLKLNLLKPGFGPISFTSLDFRAFDGSGGQNGVYVVGNNTSVKSYLGDVATSGDESTGDGQVDFNDLTLWSNSYWSGVAGYGGGMTNYKVKYDVGPTSDNTVYGLPQIDNKIQFEDLMIFAMSYGLSGDDVYPKISPAPEVPVELYLGEPIAAGNETRIPVMVTGGGVQNIRAMELSFAGQFGKLLSVEKGELLRGEDNPVMVMSREEGGKVYVDFALFGAKEEGISREGEVLVLRFEGKAGMSISSADVRNVRNNEMMAKITGKQNGVPMSYGLSQNYPNPFNPSTIISYQIPKQQLVTLRIYNVLGEKVTELVNEVQEAGYYEVQMNGASLSSGVYYYQISAGDFSSVKKMLLVK